MLSRLNGTHFYEDHERVMLLSAAWVFYLYIV